MCTHPYLLYTFSSCSFGDTLLLLSSCRREGVHSELPGVRGLFGVRLPVDVPVAPCSASSRVYVYVLRFRILCIKHFVINVINNIRTRFIKSFYVICAVIYCSFYCIYMWLDPSTYMIARFMSCYKPGVTGGDGWSMASRALVTSRMSLASGLTHLFEVWPVGVSP